MPKPSQTSLVFLYEQKLVDRMRKLVSEVLQNEYETQEPASSYLYSEEFEDIASAIARNAYLDAKTLLENK